ncbi:MAG: membrane lipoprotein lipid attachment site-containing protein [Bacilli bacterium]
MKKIVYLLVFMILLTGCSVKYELSIKNNNVNEKLTITGVTEDIPFQADLINISSTSYKKNFKNDTLIYTTNYNLNSFDSVIPSRCFENYNFTNTDNIFILRTSGIFKCLPYQYNDYDYFNYNQLELIIKTNHEVLETNATSVEEGIYKWIINEENLEDATVYIKFSDKIIKKTNWKVISIVISVIISVVLVVSINLLKKHKINNEI